MAIFLYLSLPQKNCRLCSFCIFRQLLKIRDDIIFYVQLSFFFYFSDLFYIFGKIKFLFFFIFRFSRCLFLFLKFYLQHIRPLLSFPHPTIFFLQNLSFYVQDSKNISTVFLFLFSEYFSFFWIHFNKTRKDFHYEYKVIGRNLLY